MDHATTIQHLGGANKLKAMINARQFVASTNELRFRFSGHAKWNVAMVSLSVNDTLSEGDTYALTFYKVVGGMAHNGQVMTGIYAEDLAKTFTQMTGLDLSL